MLNTAVIGCGQMGKNHVRILSEISNLVAIVDPNLELLKTMSKKYNVKGYTNYKTMLKKEETQSLFFWNTVICLINFS